MKTRIILTIILLFSPALAFSNECISESFDVFANSFFEHKNNQHSFIKFPFKMVHLVDGEHGPEINVTYLTSDSFPTIQKTINLQYEFARKRGAIKTIKEGVNSTITLKFMGPDSGYLIYYHFIKTESCWKLYSFENSSI